MLRLNFVCIFVLFTNYWMNKVNEDVFIHINFFRSLI